MSERTLMQETAVETLSDEVKADIQGFATSGFGHLRHTAYLCLEITDDAAAGRKWLGGIVPRVTSAKGWRSGPEGIKRKPETTVNLAFTCNGLAALGVSDAALCSFPRAFREGMADPARVARVLGDTGDSAPDRWLFGGPANTPIHAVLILHARTEQQLEDLVTDLRDPAGGATEVEGASQRGYRREDNKEHFGFRDGIGQPRIAGIKGRLAPNILPTGNFILGYPDHYKFVAQGPVAPATDDHEDILPPLTNPYYQGKNLRDLGRNGTYIVFRKLEQDVAGFWNFLQAEAKRSGDAGQERVAWLAASFVGRWASGAPLVLSPDKDDRRSPRATTSPTLGWIPTGCGVPLVRTFGGLILGTSFDPPGRNRARTCPTRIASCVRAAFSDHRCSICPSSTASGTKTVFRSPNYRMTAALREAFTSFALTPASKGSSSLSNNSGSTIPLSMASLPIRTR